MVIKKNGAAKERTILVKSDRHPIDEGRIGESRLNRSREGTEIDHEDSA